MDRKVAFSKAISAKLSPGPTAFQEAAARPNNMHLWPFYSQKLKLQFNHLVNNLIEYYRFLEGLPGRRFPADNRLNRDAFHTSLKPKRNLKSAPSQSRNLVL